MNRISDMKESLLPVVLITFVMTSAGFAQSGRITAQDTMSLFQNVRVERWSVFEIELEGPEEGNPFTDVSLSAEFSNGNKTYRPLGFYDGDGKYVIRFMPDEVGTWQFVTRSNRKDLDDIEGMFECTSAAPDNHGPVRVVDQHHFSFADGKRFFPVGTTLYAWHLERYEETLRTLENASINKVRFMPFPHSGNTFPPHNPWEGSANDWDFDRPNPAFWRFIENAVRDLRDRGVQADFIFFHPYESNGRQTWGLGPERMTATQRENYLKYVVARLAAYCNVWWSMANEYSLISEDTFYWEPLAATVADADPYGHLHSIHNLPGHHYPGWDQPWVTHISIQSPDVREISTWRKHYQKPVINDEYQYDGNWDPWGNLTEEEATRRIWIATLEGGYATHGEAFRPYSFFWKGGTPQRGSFSRVSWLSEEVLNNEHQPLPGGLEARDSTSASVGEDYYLHYYGRSTTSEKTFVVPEKTVYKVDILDTWNMTVTELEGTYSGTFTVTWPPDKYIAVRIYNTDLSEAVGSHETAQERAPVSVIFETDMCLDVDDVGALATLHALADNGEAQILAVSYNEVHRDGAAAIDAINTWYNRGDIPIGIYKRPLSSPDDSKYLSHVAAFPNDNPDDPNEVPSSLDVYKATLQAQPDHSVTIISVGFLNNLVDLLDNQPDLIAEKVKELVIMGGVINDNFNLVRHGLVEASERVFREWPTPIVISQPGGDILTGEALEHTPAHNPVREFYYRWFDNSFQGRSSWDQIAVLYGVRGLDYFSLQSDGSGRLRNGYSIPMQSGWRAYITKKLSNEAYEKILDDLMTKLPKTFD